MMYIRDEDIKTEDIKTAFLRMISKMQTAHDQVLKPFVMGLKGTNNKQRLKQVLTLEEQIEKKCGAGNSSNKPDEFWLYRAGSFSRRK